MAERVYLYDTTLRDGAQTQGVDFSVVDKQEIAKQLDLLGIDYIEGGWPGANPTDDGFFADLPKLKQSKMVAFGMTRRPSASAANDPGLNALVNSGAKHACIVGKTWDFHMKHALGVSEAENAKMIAESVAYLKKKGLEVQFDAEHFFDGFKANKKVALNAIKAAYDSGARWVILCDTNGGTLPHEVEKIVKEAVKTVPGKNLGVHCHNDTENAVANSIAAVLAGVRQVQGTIGGYGERCGNTNLITMIPTLKFKLGYEVGITPANMKKLTQIAHSLDDRLNRPRYRHAAYVGASAFAHKGGLHVSAVVKNADAYEHIKPEDIGNKRVILVSDQSGRANIISRLDSLGIKINPKDPKVNALVDEVKRREAEGYAYDSADASFELLAKSMLGQVPDFYEVKNFRVIDERRWNARGELVIFSEAKVKMRVDGKEKIVVAEGEGPVSSLNKALRKILVRHYPQLKEIKLVDFKVRIIAPEKATEAITRVQIETEDKKTKERWTTIGVSDNIIDASYNALNDAFIYKLMKR